MMEFIKKKNLSSLCKLYKKKKNVSRVSLQMAKSRMKKSLCKLNETSFWSTGANQGVWASPGDAGDQELLLPTIQGSQHYRPHCVTACTWLMHIVI